MHLAPKTLVTHITDGFDFLGFHIRRTRRRDGRTVVHTYPSSPPLAAVTRKIKKATARGTTSLRMADVLRVVNPILRGWANYFRYGVSKRTFSYLGYYAWWRLITGFAASILPSPGNRCAAASTGRTASAKTASCC